MLPVPRPLGDLQHQWVPSSPAAPAALQISHCSSILFHLPECHFHLLSVVVSSVLVVFIVFYLFYSFTVIVVGF